MKKGPNMAKLGSLEGLQQLERRFWEKFYIQILKGVSAYKGWLLYPGIGAWAYKRGTFLILQIGKISFIGAGTYMRGNRVSFF